MFCYQCEQTFRGFGCTDLGVCGKDARTAELQDLLIHAAKGIAMYAHRAARLGATDGDVDAFVLEALFATGTNVNFDPVRLRGLLLRAAEVRDQARSLYEAACGRSGITPETLTGPAGWVPEAEPKTLFSQARQAGLEPRLVNFGPDLTGLQELVLYGLKGAGAYAAHTLRLGWRDSSVFASFHELLDLLTRPDHTSETLLAAALRTGELNLRVMRLLDDAHTSTFGHPEPTPVRTEPLKGKAILVSGHDLSDLYALLLQTKDKGIHVYTHGELLPAHGYPKFKAFKHLTGNYGGAWMNQTIDFDAFPGAVLMTSNCIQRPADTYWNRLFTAGPVAWPGVPHVSDGNFSPVIEAALRAPGFTEDGPDHRITVGFGRQAVLSLAGRIVQAVNSGAIRHFFLIGGCDGAKLGRSYYTDFAAAVPQDCLILTLACGKYRFNKLDFGSIDGLPRLLDIGQCNDAYSAIQIVQALSEAFGRGVNDLPVSLILSWYEQKAVAILLTLLYLGIRNIRLGPSLPVFLTPTARKFLAETFNIMPLRPVEEELKTILG